jgi:hypothetical protein
MIAGNVRNIATVFGGAGGDEKPQADLNPPESLPCERPKAAR